MKKVKPWSCWWLVTREKGKSFKPSSFRWSSFYWTIFKICFQLSGRRGLVDGALGSGDRDWGFKSQSWQSGFSGGFFLLLHFLHYGSIRSVVCPCGSSFRLNTVVGWENTYRGQLVTERGDLYEKILAAPSVGWKHRYKCNVWGQSKKGFLWLPCNNIIISKFCLISIDHHQ